MRNVHCFRLAALGMVCVAGYGQNLPVRADIRLSAPTFRPIGQPSAMVGPALRYGVLQLRTATLSELISAAYGVETQKVVGGPRSIEWTKFDIDAEVPPGRALDDMKGLLRLLLAQRFDLAVHNDTRPVVAWVLDSATKPKLMKSEGAGTPGCQADPVAGPRRPTRAYTCSNVSMSDFAIRLPALAPVYVQGMAVVDRTGLSGTWDFHFEFSPLGASGPDDIALPGALEKQLGLTLTQTPVSSPVLVVDRATEQPSPNPVGAAESILRKLPPAFEVASLKISETVSGPGARVSMQITPGGGVDYHNVPLTALIRNAFQDEVGGPALTDDRIKGAPASLNQIRVDIAARPSSSGGTQGASPLDRESAVRMLKALLIDRFNIRYHVETRDGDALRMVAANPKLKLADPGERTKANATSNGTGPGGGGILTKISFQNVSTAEMAEKLSYAGDAEIQSQQVVDGTGMDGRYDLILEYGLVSGLSPADGQTAPVGITISEALRSKAGLRLVKTKVPVKLLIIDQINATPKEN